MNSEHTIADAAGAQRRGLLKCMLWAGTGVLWTVSGGVPRSALLGGGAMAASGEFSFVQISDSHIGFAKPPNTDTPATLRAAIDRVTQLKGNASLLLHTGDVSHLSRADAVRHRGTDHQGRRAGDALRAGRT